MSTIGQGEFISWQQHGGRRRRHAPIGPCAAVALGGVAVLVAAQWGYLHDAQLSKALSAVMMAPLGVVGGLTSLKAFITWIKG